MKLCPHCSSQLEETAVRCGRCGKWVVEKRKGEKKQKKKGSNPVRLLLLGVVAVFAYAVWALPEKGVNPRELLDLKPSREAGFQAMRSDLERLMTLQERYYRDHGEYSGSPADLGFAPTDAVIVSLIAIPTGWSGAATYQEFAKEEGCAVYVGSINPPRAPLRPRVSGRLECTERES